ncbi:phosphoadenylyl-sulfate reductase [bacterium]|nr:phosphoadenylyl-sulfate reductase [bacterium]
MKQIDIDALNKQYKNASLEEVLTYAIDTFKNKCVLASSLGLEDQLLTYHFLKRNPKARIFVLDTGRLHQETYNTITQTMNQYRFNYEIYYPDTDAVEKMISKKGPNSFYESIENRKECCNIRKTEPLKRVLKTASAWITGLRRDQSITRKDMLLFEEDKTFGILKINPLINWTYQDIWEHIKKYKIPYNMLHDKGFPSIGCDPCTRAIKPEEDIRAGRWWWEDESQKECGLHIVDGKLVRAKKSDTLK